MLGACSWTVCAPAPGAGGRGSRNLTCILPGSRAAPRRQGRACRHCWMGGPSCNVAAPVAWRFDRAASAVRCEGYLESEGRWTGTRRAQRVLQVLLQATNTLAHGRRKPMRKVRLVGFNAPPDAHSAVPARRPRACASVARRASLDAACAHTAPSVSCGPSLPARVQPSAVSARDRSCTASCIGQAGPGRLVHGLRS